MGTRMLQRRGSAAEWTAANPVLGDGEIGWIKDSDLMKIGDGVTAWDDLDTFRYVHQSLIQAKGDLLVGSASETVARLARGTTGQSIYVQADGSLAYQTPYAGADRVAKSGDTMTGPLGTTRVDLGGVNLIDFGTGLAVLGDDLTTLEPIHAGAVYDNGYRVYSQSNPPPGADFSPYATVVQLAAAKRKWTKTFLAMGA